MLDKYNLSDILSTKRFYFIEIAFRYVQHIIHLR